MAKNGYTAKPYPKIIIVDAKNDEEPIFRKTGYYDPLNKVVVLFTYERFIKDVLRSLAHEMIHHKQNLDGKLGEGSYDGMEITKDKKLIKLEEEAYLKGNIAFRSWTEVEKERGQ